MSQAEEQRKLSPFAGDLTEKERQQQQEKYGRVIFAPCGCISLEEFAREQEREDRIKSLSDKLLRAKAEKDVIRKQYEHIIEENISLQQENNKLVDKIKLVESTSLSKTNSQQSEIKVLVEANKTLVTASKKLEEKNNKLEHVVFVTQSKIKDIESENLSKVKLLQGEIDVLRTMVDTNKYPMYISKK